MIGGFSGTWAVVLAFALGSIPFSFLLARFSGVDIRRVGSGNIGATNLARAVGYGRGILGLLLDAGKGAAAVFLVPLLLPEGDGATAAAAAAAAVAGHIFTPFLGFRGGKGVATGAGAFAALTPRACLAALLVFGLVLAIGRMVSLGSAAASAALPIAAHITGAGRPATLAALLVAALILARHRDNFARIARGSEHRLGSKRPAGPP